MKPSFITRLKFENAGMHEGERLIRLKDELDALTKHGVIRAVEGFVSNGCSIPIACFSLLGHPYDGYLDSAVIHDLLYRKDHGYPITRKQADILLRDLMATQGYGFVKRNAFYLGVRAGGWLSYKKLSVKFDPNPDL
jgi:Protein of unknown function (DUF1353)